MIKKILVSQPSPSSAKSPYYDIEKKYGVTFTFYPLIKVERLTAKEFREQRVNITEHTAIIFNSRHAVDHFFNLCKDLRITITEDLKYFAISETVALYIQKYVQYRKRKVFFSKTGKWPELYTLLTKHKTENYLFPQSNVHSTEVHTTLTEKKIQFTPCLMYRTVANPLPSDIPFDFDMVVLFTPTGVGALLEHYAITKEQQLPIGAFGHNTAKAISEAGLNLCIEAPNAQSPSITGAIELFLQEQS